jgi:hypothetical protein
MDALEELLTEMEDFEFSGVHGFMIYGLGVDEDEQMDLTEVL